MPATTTQEAVLLNIRDMLRGASIASIAASADAAIYISTTPHLTADHDAFVQIVPGSIETQFPTSGLGLIEAEFAVVSWVHRALDYHGRGDYLVAKDAGSDADPVLTLAKSVRAHLINYEDATNSTRIIAIPVRHLGASEPQRYDGENGWWASVSERYMVGFVGWSAAG